MGEAEQKAIRSLNVDEDSDKGFQSYKINLAQYQSEISSEYEYASALGDSYEVSFDLPINYEFEIDE